MSRAKVLGLQLKWSSSWCTNSPALQCEAGPTTGLSSNSAGLAATTNTMFPSRPRTSLQREFPRDLEIPTTGTLGPQSEQEYVDQFYFMNALSAIAVMEQEEEEAAHQVHSSLDDHGEREDGLVPFERRPSPWQTLRRARNFMDSIAVEIVSDPADYVENARLHLPFAPRPGRSYDELEIAPVRRTQQPAGVWVHYESGSGDTYSRVSRVYVALIETHNRRLVGDLNLVRLRFLCREGATSHADERRVVEWMLAGSGGTLWEDCLFWDAPNVQTLGSVGPSPRAWNQSSLFIFELA